jgi:hypothetical protein
MRRCCAGFNEERSPCILEDGAPLARREAEKTAGEEEALEKALEEEEDEIALPNKGTAGFCLGPGVIPIWLGLLTRGRAE